MSRVTKWKLEKTKVKVVFRLQFHATHIPQSGCDKLYISLIPAESGKVTAKTTKANVRNGTCKWGDPIYETTRLLQDVKTKQFEEKLYKLVVAMGSSRSSILGEASINLADYADALKPTVVQLSLKGSSDSGAVLHVTVQLLTSKTGFREFEQQREISERGLQASSDHDGSRVSLSGDTTGSHLDKVSSRVKFKPEQKLLPSLEEEAGLSSEDADLATGLDGSSNTSESLYAEKHDASGSHDVDSVKSTMSGDTPGISLSQSPTPEKGDSSNNRTENRDWVHYYGTNNSVDHDLSIVYREDNSLKEVLEAAELSIHELKKEVTTLQTHTDDIGSEMHRLTEQLSDEISSTNELVKDVSVLKSECSRFKGGIESLTNLKIDLLVSRSGNNNADQSQFSRWLKSILTLEDKIRDIQNKTYIGFHEKDFRFLIPDLDSLLGVLLDVKQGTGDLASSFDNMPAGESNLGNFSHVTLPKNQENLLTTAFGMDVCQPEGLLGLNISGLVSQETDATKAMQGELFKLLRELDESKSERESLARKMGQMECYYEALVQELEENQKQMLGELQNLRNEHSTCIHTLSSTKAQMGAMHQDMSEQILRLAEERCSIDSLNKELERRAIAAEAALRRARLNYSIAVNQLQRDLEVLSLQVLSMYETNESLIRKAFSEVSQTYLEEYPEPVPSDNLATKEPKLASNTACHNQKVGVRNVGNMLSEDLNDSLVFHEELYKKIEQEVFEGNLTNIYLDVFARSLQETLQEAIADIELQSCKTNELLDQLQLSMKSNEALTLKLQAAEYEIDASCKEKADNISRDHELGLHNEALEADLRSLSAENRDLAERFAESEALLTEYRVYRSRYEACDAEKTALTSTLEKSKAENNDLVNQICLLQDELKKINTESIEILSSKQSLHKLVDFLKQKLQIMLAAHGEETNNVSLSHEFLDADLELKRIADVVSLLENHQMAATEKMLHLMKEKKGLEGERDIANLSLTAKNSELEALREKFELRIGELTCKLEGFNTNMENLEEKLDNVCEKMKTFSEAEGSCTGIMEELLSLISRVEMQLNEFSDKNDDLTREIFSLGVISEELEGVKLIVAESTQEKQDLIACLQSKTNELTLLESEICSLKVSLRNLTDELSVERNSRERFKNQLSDVTAELDEKNKKLLHFEQLETELFNLRKQFQDLELEKSRVCDDLSDFTNEKLLHLQQQETELFKLRKLFQDLEFEKSRVCNELSDITSQLNEKNMKILQFEQQQPELVLLRTQFCDSELERSRVCDKLSDVEKLLKEARDESTTITDLEADLVNMHEQLIAADIMEVFMKTQCKCQIEDLVPLLESSKKHITELNKKNLDLQRMLDESLHQEANYATANKKLQSEYESVKFQLEEYVALNKAIQDSHCAIVAEAEESKKNNALLESCYSEAMTMHAFEVERLNCVLENSLKDIDNLMSSKQELEIVFVVLKNKLDEQFSLKILLEQYDNELTMLQKWCDELSLRLSEQTLKTEEFKNLSIHLKELKDKADAECLRAREKKEDVVSSVAAQESLRIAFIKEQYETKVQELRQQLSISKKHGEEMLMKLQDAIDEVEKRRKAEAIHLKRNEEQSLKILELEDELRSALSDNRDKAMAYDQVKAELECSLISLECCKEEKQKLFVSVQECNDEKSRIAGELSRMRECLSSSAAAKILTDEKEVSQAERLSCERATGVFHLENEDESVACVREDTDTASLDMSSGNGHHKKLQHESLTDVGEENGIPVHFDKGLGKEHRTAHSTRQDDARGVQADSLESPSSDMKTLSPSIEQLKAQDLKSSMDFLHKELEKMKSENSVLLEDEFEPHMEGLRRELIKLEKVNEELRNMSPEYRDFSSYGNSMERVLALVMELAEALREKKSSTLQFQSSFLKQHNDEAAVFRSFKDISDLIKDMLDLKGKYSTVETELKEMHERYSELSLQFAEVEGERQKLMMTLKNVRSSRRLSVRGSPASPGGPAS